MEQFPQEYSRFPIKVLLESEEVALYQVQFLTQDTMPARRPLTTNTPPHRQTHSFSQYHSAIHQPVNNSKTRRGAIHILIISGAGLLLLCGVALSTPAQAAELCHRPTPEALIAWYNKGHAKEPLDYNAKGSAIYHPISILRTEDPVTYWIGLAWLFPQSGALFAVNCQGTILDGIPTGAIGHLVPGPKLPEIGQSVMIVYVAKETGNCVHDAVKIMALKDNRMIPLWTHGYNLGINLPAADDKPRRFTKETYKLELSDDQRTLSISGLRATYPYLKGGNQAPIPSTSETLPAENYHWDAKALRYLPTKSYPKPQTCSPAVK